MKAFVIDPNECCGCYCCQRACKDEHCGNDWTPYAKPQPDTGQYWGHMIETERGNTPHVRIAYVFTPCQHCENAPCIAACPEEGALYERPDGLVIIDPKKCTGCQLCIPACPYDVIYYNPTLHIAQKCTGCAHLIDRGYPLNEPRCSDVCFHEAIKFGEDTDFDLSGTETLHAEYGLTTRVHYKNLPKRFIAGTVYTPSDKEVAIGATCTLTGDGGPYTATTDEFGDFWFEPIPAADFTLTIEKAGKAKTMSVSTKERDVGLGDIPLT
jgi:Fe-S-cluster-containing dehydrogenase component